VVVDEVVARPPRSRTGLVGPEPDDEVPPSGVGLVQDAGLVQQPGEHPHVAQVGGQIDQNLLDRDA